MYTQVHQVYVHLFCRAEFITSTDKYNELYTESHVVHKYGALFLDYCFTMTTDPDHVTGTDPRVKKVDIQTM